MNFIITILFFLVLTPHSHAAAYEKALVWPKNKITVCFRELKNDDKNNGLYEPLISFIKETVEKEFHQKTNVSFIWETCKDSVKYDAFISFNPKSGESSTTPIDQSNTRDLVFGTEKLKLDDDLEKNQFTGTVIHEFGHLLGLMHEHEYFYKSAKKDPKCNAFMEIQKFINELGASTQAMAFLDGNPLYKIFPRYFYFKKGRRAFGEYDSNSIMNYCHIVEFDKLNPNSPSRAIPTLSSQDIATINKLYQ